MKPKAVLTISILSAVLFAVSGCNTAKNSPPDTTSESSLTDDILTESSDNISSEISEKSDADLNYSSFFSVASKPPASSKNTGESSADSRRSETHESSKNESGSYSGSGRHETPASSANVSGSYSGSGRHETPASSANESGFYSGSDRHETPASSANGSGSYSGSSRHETPASSANGSGSSSSRNETSVQRHTHRYFSTVYSPGCTNRGYTVHTCSCGKTYVDNYTNALGHSWGSWRTVYEATTTQNGVQKRYCGRCGAEETRYTDKLPSTNFPVFTTRVVEIVNAERRKNNLKPLEIDITLMEDAAVRSVELMTKFNHIRPNGQNGYDMAFDAGYMTVGENIAFGQTSPEAVMKSWMSSPGHRANILKEDFTNIGVGCYLSENGGYYWVQLFGG